MAPAADENARQARGRIRPWVVVALGSWLLAAASPGLRTASAQNKPAEGPVVEIKVEGNQTIEEEKIRAKLLSRTGRPLDEQTVEADVRTLLGTRWFSDVTPHYDKAPDGQGYILIFHVRELPVLQSVEFRGRSKLKLKDLEETTGLKAGARADALRARLAVAQIKRLYEEKGFEYAEVKLLEGGEDADRRVIVQIFEGPQLKVGGIDFVGNATFSDAMLRTKIGTRTAILGFGGKFFRETLEEDRRKLIEYYQSLGYFDVEIRYFVSPATQLGDLRLKFVVHEGVQYKVRNITFVGNKRLDEAKLREGLALHSGQPLLDMARKADFKALMSKYYDIGCIATQILPDPRVTDEPGVMDLVYKIEEGEPFYLGDLFIKGNHQTRDRVLRREAVMAGLLPGELLNLNRIDLYKTRLGGLQLFNTSPEQGQPIDVRVVNYRSGDKVFGDVPLADLSEVTLTRMQDPGPDLEPLPPLDPGPPPPLESAPAPGAGGAVEPGPSGVVPFGSGGLFAPPPNTLPPINVPAPPADTFVPAPAPDGRTPVGTGEPTGSFPSLPGGNMNDVGPDRQEPFANRSYADIVTQVDEAPTGRLLFGIGASTFGGLSGNLIVHERNFDITRFPRSWGELSNGQAFRGAGQEFRLELAPGTLINRFMVSFREPYLFDLPIGLSTSGYLFQRIYPDWTEGRGGGRFALGRQFGVQTYADVAFRIEDVNFYGYQTPAPADYLAVSGHTTLATLRPSLRFDNRNNPFVATRGSYLEFAFEQGWGTFTFPKVTVEGRQHFTLATRPDGTGARFVTARGFFGATGRDTPVYERFYAGDFRSMRGFQYRGVGPRVLDKAVGGVMSAIGSIEYQFPWTPDDRFQQVIFCDFGTVEADYKFTNFRAAVGTGLRVNIPALGPLPLAFDLAFPVAKEEGDRTRYFTFFIGAFW